MDTQRPTTTRRGFLKLGGVSVGAAALGVLLYSGVGVVSIVNGGEFLDYDRLFTPEIEAQISGRYDF